ncbi:MAG: methylaspartate mutase subunit S [Tissierellia bacterium]|nr:methylaspartate mutase subunit S [Tissierellia bacterium]
MTAKTLVLGVIGSDCHAVGNKILDHTLSQAGFNVVNIGVLSSQEDFINAAIETKADAILVSSLYGQGELDVKGLREKCDEAGLEGIKLYVGGNIVVGKQNWEDVFERFKNMGFDRVYRPGTSVDTTINDLNEDLGVN